MGWGVGACKMMLRAPPPKKAKPKEESDDDEEDFKKVSSAKAEGSSGASGAKWYEEGGEGAGGWKRGGQKWNTLEHCGVLFPPLYEAHGVTFKYEGDVVPLNADQEEVCTMYAAMLATDYAKNEVSSLPSSSFPLASLAGPPEELL